MRPPSSLLRLVYLVKGPSTSSWNASTLGASLTSSCCGAATAAGADDEEGAAAGGGTPAAPTADAFERGAPLAEVRATSSRRLQAASRRLRSVARLPTPVDAAGWGGSVSGRGRAVRARGDDTHRLRGVLRHQKRPWRYWQEQARCEVGAEPTRRAAPPRRLERRDLSRSLALRWSELKERLRYIASRSSCCHYTGEER